MSNLQPPDDGVRRYRPGPLMILGTLGLIALGWILFSVIREKQQATPEPVVETKTIIEEIREPAPPEPPPHPIIGKRRIFLADGSLYRTRELTFTRNLSTQHDFPVAVLLKNDPCLWDFQPVEGKEEVYRIFCADENFPDELGKNLTYTRLKNDPLIGDVEIVDDQPPYLTLRNDDPCEWEVRKMPHQNQYELYCRLGSEPYLGQSLGWMEEQEDLKYDVVTATLGQNGNPSWWILPPDQKPTTPRLVTHLIIMPRGEPEDLEKAREHYKEHGTQVFEVEIKTAEDTLTRTAGGISFLKLVRSLQGKDPVLEHDDFPPLLKFDITRIPSEDNLFPLVIPLKIALPPGEIREFTFKDTEFYLNTWEKFENLQGRLDESDVSDGRVFKGEKFTYFFVAAEQ
ncbi:hypothetical protein V2O64_18140 [Verrucomicrobiaceae bacterium 227]